MSPKLIVISAPSGAGKTTLCKRLLSDFPELTLSISSTTRAPRGQEKHGQEYYFLSKADFEAGIKAGSFVEWAQVHGNYYGTSRDTLEQAFRAGKSVLLDIDVQGAAQLKKAFPEKVFSVFVSTPDLDTLEQRLRARGTDTEETIQKRLKNAREEMKEMPLYHHVVINDELGRAYLELRALIELQLRDVPASGGIGRP